MTRIDLDENSLVKIESLLLPADERHVLKKFKPLMYDNDDADVESYFRNPLELHRLYISSF